MAIEIVWGKVTNRLAIESLIETLKALSIDGTLYLGYPILASADSNVTVEALLVSQTPGLVAFNFPPHDLPINELKEIQDKLGYAIDANLSRHDSLRQRRHIGVIANIISYFSEERPDLQLNNNEYQFANSDNLSACFKIIKGTQHLIAPIF